MKTLRLPHLTFFTIVLCALSFAPSASAAATATFIGCVDYPERFCFGKPSVTGRATAALTKSGATASITAPKLRIIPRRSGTYSIRTTLYYLCTNNGGAVQAKESATIQKNLRRGRVYSITAHALTARCKDGVVLKRYAHVQVQGPSSSVSFANFG